MTPEVGERELNQQKRDRQRVGGVGGLGELLQAKLHAGHLGNAFLGGSARSRHRLLDAGRCKFCHRHSPRGAGGQDHAASMPQHHGAVHVLMNEAFFDGKHGRGMFGQNLVEMFPELGQAFGERDSVSQAPDPGFADAGHATTKVLEDRKSAAQAAGIDPQDLQAVLIPSRLGRLPRTPRCCTDFARRRGRPGCPTASSPSGPRRRQPGWESWECA
jgi:hypothetical protein